MLDNHLKLLTDPLQNPINSTTEQPGSETSHGLLCSSKLVHSEMTKQCYDCDGRDGNKAAPITEKSENKNHDSTLTVTQCANLRPF